MSTDDMETTPRLDPAASLEDVTDYLDALRDAADEDPIKRAAQREQAIRDLSEVEEVSAPAKMVDSALDGYKPAGVPAGGEAGGEEDPDPEQLEAWWEKGRRILEAQDQLALFREKLDEVGYAGDLTPLELVHVALNSRNLPRPINLVLKGPSAAGKTYTVETSLEFHPEDAVLELDASSARYLAYMSDPTEHRYVFVAEGDAFHREGIGASIVRSLAWGEGIRYGTVMTTEHGPEAVEIVKPGPTGLITTSTHELQEEIETRLITIPVTDSPDQTSAVVRELAREAEGDLPPDPDLGAWVAASRLLSAAGEKRVVVPFASDLADRVPVKDVRMRRDFGQVLNFIRALAFMHQVRRERDGEGRVVAASRDYENARRLMSRVLQVTQSAVTEEVREAVDAVAEMTAPDGGHAGGVSYPDLGDALGLTRAGARYRCLKALRRGWLVNAEDRKGYPARLRVGDPLPEDHPVLPPPEDLFERGVPSSPPPKTTFRLSTSRESPGSTGDTTVKRAGKSGGPKSERSLYGGGSLSGGRSGSSSRNDAENPGSVKAESDLREGGGKGEGRTLKRRRCRRASAASWTVRGAPMADHDELIRLAVRIWTAAEQIDALRGGERCWRWTHRQVARLTEEGRQEDPKAVEKLAAVLEDRLEMERARRREEVER